MNPALTWWRRYRRCGVSLDRDENQLRQREADRAVRQSRASRRAVEADWPEVHHVARELRQAQTQNHFADAFRQLIEGGRE